VERADEVPGSSSAVMPLEAGTATWCGGVVDTAGKKEEKGEEEGEGRAVTSPVLP